MASQSPAEQLARLPKAEQDAFLARLTDVEALALLTDWRGFLARPDQVAPVGDWDIWIALAGRGWGKTETGAQWVREESENPKAVFALVAETAFDARSVMVKRLLSIFPEGEQPIWEPSKRLITFASGATAYTYNGTEPDQLRGPEHSHFWADEIAKWRYAREAWDQLQFGLRVGSHPRGIVTTTPRPIDLVRKILAGKEGKVAITRGKTMDNASNLPARFLAKIQERYAGTRLGRQELDAEVLDDVPGALWPMTAIDHAKAIEMEDIARIVVAVDPSGSDGNAENGADEIGIIVAAKLINGNFAVLEDATCSLSPNGWGRRAVDRYRHHGAALIVAERNYGGAMVESVIKASDQNANVKLVTASRGKSVRAEPIAALYEQKRVRHAPGLDQLEDQMMKMTLTGYIGEGSPDRVDALVWAMTELMDAASPSIRSL